MKVNVVHVLMGGVLAGVVVNVWGVAVAMIPAWQLGQELPRSWVPVGMALAYLIGIITVWLYAFMSVQHGPGLKTAAVAAAAVWTVGYAIQSYVMWDSEPLNGSLRAQRAGMSLAGFLLATCAGAWIYDRPAGRAVAIDRRSAMGPVHRMLVEAGALLAAYYILVSVMIALDIGGIGAAGGDQEVDRGGGAVSMWPATRFSVTAAIHALVAGTLMLAAVWATIRAARRGASGQTLWLGTLLVLAIGMVPIAAGLAWVFSISGLAILVVAFLIVRAVSVARVRVGP